MLEQSNLRGLPIAHAMCVMIRHSPSDCRSLSSPALPEAHFATVLHCMGCSVAIDACDGATTESKG